MTTAAITWFEIPARNLDRAQAFYESLLGQPLRRESMGGATLALFPGTDGGASGCLQAGPMAAEPTTQGTLVYLDTGAPMAGVLARVPALGGQVATPCTALPPGMGFYAHILDTEGNRVGLHADQ